MAAVDWVKLAKGVQDSQDGAWEVTSSAWEVKRGGGCI